MSESRFRISSSGSCEISSCMVCKECSSQPNGGYFCEKLLETDRHHCTLRDYPTFPDNCPFPKKGEIMNGKEIEVKKKIERECSNCTNYICNYLGGIRQALANSSGGVPLTGGMLDILLPKCCIFWKEL